ncbi:hypothetical protein QBC46DRAFT_322766 [Diplogelasinospora grovesii]|uniref:Uncharacterized protein n=1 Tax=Diplogelasinospora grovesii TaxID=303347 RepID=A0AAN6MYA8_9PEZI|nr:hypothetical protein QBC46DRAFT_322766 [Diplogelasinospora grovesii]
MATATPDNASAGGGNYREHPQLNPSDPIPPADPAAVDSVKELYNAIREKFPDAVADFQARWLVWKNVACPKYGVSSNAFATCEGPEFDKLVALGPKIVPLVVYKLATDNRLEKNRHYLVDPNDLLNYKVLQRQANLIVDMNYERNKLADADLKDWSAYCWKNQMHSSNSGIFTDCQETQDLLSLGPSIVAHLMLAYGPDDLNTKHPGIKFSYELLQRIVYGDGEETGLPYLDFKGMYVAWAEWFQRGEHSQTPRWIRGMRVDGSSADPGPAPWYNHLFPPGRE